MQERQLYKYPKLCDESRKVPSGKESNGRNVNYVVEVPWSSCRTQPDVKCDISRIDSLLKYAVFSFGKESFGKSSAHEKSSFHLFSGLLASFSRLTSQPSPTHPPQASCPKALESREILFSTVYGRKFFDPFLSVLYFSYQNFSISIR